ncbi:MAG: hypothetical protein HC796_05105 [Synechococcaceae cyanobacterium RL_1_2]|nr:hypothetical protein [Synechococcaceae cyanobacterium RL_1_2]
MWVNFIFIGENLTSLTSNNGEGCSDRARPGRSHQEIWVANLGSKFWLGKLEPLTANAKSKLI